MWEVQTHWLKQGGLPKEVAYKLSLYISGDAEDRAVGRANAQRWDAVLPSGTCGRQNHGGKGKKVGWAGVQKALRRPPSCLTLSALGGRLSNHLCVTLRLSTAG